LSEPTLSLEQKFLFDEFCVLAWGASVQHACIYLDKSITNKRKYEFRRKILSFIEREILPNYSLICSDENHVDNIMKLVTYGCEIGRGILRKDGYKIGVAQKLLNLLLKYMWCLGLIVEPPHCPIDRIVLSETTLRGKLNWTAMTRKDEYLKAIEAVRCEASKNRLTLANWELQCYSRR
jgi:hypothetical protein